MLHDGISFMDNAVASNFQIENGPTFPTEGNTVGKMFYLLTDSTYGLYVYNGTSWEQATIVIDATQRDSTIAKNWLFEQALKVGDPVEADDAATKEYVDESIAPLPTKQYVDSAVAPLATKTALSSAISPLATKTELSSAVSPLATKTELSTATANVAKLNVTQTFEKAQRGKVGAPAFASTMALDFSTTNNFKFTATGNFTMALPENLVEGQSGMIVVKQDVTGSRVVTWAPGWVAAGGAKPILSTAANSVDYLAYYVEAADRVFVGASLAVF